jgi:hypothetical protein
MSDSHIHNGSGGVLRTGRVPRAAAVFAVALGSLLAACSSSPTTSSTSTTATVRAVYLDKSGAGNSSIAAVTLPAKWTAAWRFICDQTPGSKSFVLTATDHGGSPTVVTNQTGLGGGGQKPYTKSGAYSFQIKTACVWKLSVKPTPKTASHSTTATTATTASTATTKAG